MRFETALKAILIHSVLICVGLWGLAASTVRTGADRLFEKPFIEWLQGKRIGLISNHTGVTSELRSVWELIEEHPGLQLTTLFAPEHGFEGSLQAGDKVTTRRNIYSLYGRHRAPTAEMLQEVDVLVFDLQDVGVRFYTYTSTLLETMKAAAQAGLPLIVLDRPDPIGGLRVEGPVLESGFESFVGAFRVPVRYGLTIGELARFFNSEAGIGCDLRVVPLKNWKRSDWYDDTGLPWVPPSPNMPKLETAVVYPGFCLMEGTNLSEGRGTALPFEWFGAPWLKSHELVRELNRLELPGVRFRAQVMTPTFSKFQGIECAGVQIHVIDRNLFQPVETALRVLFEIRRLHPGEFEWKDSFDRLAGNSWVRSGLTAGREPAEIAGRWAKELEEFKKKRTQYLLY